VSYICPDCRADEHEWCWKDDDPYGDECTCSCTCSRATGPGGKGQTP
jgi:hypothetical protein